MRRLLVVLGLLAGLLLPTAVPALAEPPFRLTGQVTDRVGALSGNEDDVDRALAELRDADGTQLWVVYVSSFDGADGTAWAEDTAPESQLGGNDVLFAVAVDDRAYGYWFDPAADRDADDVDRLIADDVEPELADGGWAGAATAFAEGLRPRSVWPAVAVVAVAILLVVGLVKVNGGRKRRKAEEERRRPEDPFPGEPTESVRGRAATALLEMDEALRASQVDLDFARLQYGEAAVADAVAAFAQARAELEQAFAVRQRLDDEHPEDDEATRKLLAELLRLAESADRALDEALARGRDEQARQQAARARLDRALSGARTVVDTAPRTARTAAVARSAEAAAAAGTVGAAGSEPAGAGTPQGPRACLSRDVLWGGPSNWRSAPCVA